MIVSTNMRPDNARNLTELTSEVSKSVGRKISVSRVLNCLIDVAVDNRRETLVDIVYRVNRDREYDTVSKILKSEGKNAQNHRHNKARKMG